MAARQREYALKDYKARPNLCTFCGQAISIPAGVKVSEIRTRRFCGHSCAARYSNQRRGRCASSAADRHCKQCGKATSEGARACRACDIARRQALKATTKKAELFARRRAWPNARAAITSHARAQYAASGRPRRCEVWGYERHVNVAHRKPVSAFRAEATLAEINRIGNLVALCPNHHWELDHGLLSL